MSHNAAAQGGGNSHAAQPYFERQTHTQKKEHVMTRSLIFCATATALMLGSGCAGIQSSKIDPTKPVPDGLVYFLPKRAVIVTLTVPKEGAPSVSVEPSAAYADTSKAYVVSLHRNQAGTNKLAVEVNENGLLQSASSDTTSALTTVLGQAAELAATSVLTLADQKEIPCLRPGSYQKYLFDDTKDVHLCGITFTLAFTEPAFTPTDTARMGSSRMPGFFYRPNRPATVTVDGTLALSETLGYKFDDKRVVSLPNHSPVAFLPIARNAFGSNKSSFVFVDGMPKKYSQDIDGEALGVLKLPASILKSYADALTSNFKRQQGIDRAEIDNTLAQLKRDRCLAAIATKDETKIAAACAP
jgi:hypothetical protein